MRWLVIAAAACTLFATFAATPARARGCGSIFQEGFSPAKITATNTTCADAKRLAKQVSKNSAPQFNGCVKIGTRGLQLVQPCVRFRYRCRTLRRIGEGGTGLRIGCKRGARDVRWNLE